MTGRVRCAIYTRKSTEEGLDQEFNSLDAQREACEAYIRSQAGEGWRALPEQYDDGGFSGGNLDRPAMQRLLSDIDRGKVDVIVVYKVDRLTRSLMDFARIVERLDAKGVSFVSVTQQFNTTSSMGRLTLNVLLSFAQFEREVTGERIRDKIAASKAKGMWMGGNIPLGYDLADRRLVVNEAEAEQVRHIFRRYLELRSGVLLAKELRRDGFVSKRCTSRSGRHRGGLPFSCGALYYLLQNRIYLGEIVHRGVRHEGEHEAIVADDLFEAVQQVLAENRQRHRERRPRSTKCPLVGLLQDAAGEQMSPSFSYGRGGRLYRYYVSGSLDPSRSIERRPIRIPAAPLERVVLQSLSTLTGRQLALGDALATISSIRLHELSIHIALAPGSVGDPHESCRNVIERLQPRIEPDRLLAKGEDFLLIIDRQPALRGGRPTGSPETSSSQAAEVLRMAHRLLEAHSMSPTKPEEHVGAAAPAWQRQRRTMALGLLSPTLQKALLRSTHDGSIERLLSEPPPLAWADQLRDPG